jgi:hypothetical protein
MKCDPTDAEGPFNLGNMLWVNGRQIEAEAAFRAATRASVAWAVDHAVFSSVFFALGTVAALGAAAPRTVGCETARRAVSPALPAGIQAESIKKSLSLLRNYNKARYYRWFQSVLRG